MESAKTEQDSRLIKEKTKIRFIIGFSFRFSIISIQPDRVKTSFVSCHTQCLLAILFLFNNHSSRWRDSMKALLIALTTLVTFSVQADSQVISFLLRELSQNFDTSVQTEIIKTLKDYNSDSQVMTELQRTLNNPFGVAAVRIEAARSLSELAGDQSIAQAIIKAHDQSRDISFRAEMIKCLYKFAPVDARVRNVLLRNLKENHDDRIKVASAFALQESLGDIQTRNEVISLAENSFLTSNTRIALVKILYNGMNESEVRRALERIALNQRDDLNVRSAATRIISTQPPGRGYRNVLFDIITNSQSAQLKVRATSGLRFKLTEEDIIWLGLPVDPRTNLPRNPF